MSDAPSIRASLVLYDFGDDPRVVTEVLGIDPSRSGKSDDVLKGPAGQPTSRAVRRTYWSLHSRLDPTASLGQQVDDIVEQLGDNASAFHRLPRGTTVRVRCTVIPEDDLPLLSVSSGALKRLGEIGADLEIDVLSVDGPVEV